MVMKKLLIIYAMLLLLPIGLLAQNDSISKTKNVYKNQVDLNLELFGVVFGYKKRIHKNWYLGTKVGVGIIASYIHYENNYTLGSKGDLVNTTLMLQHSFKDFLLIESGPKLSLLIDDEGQNNPYRFEWELGVYAGLRKIQLGIRFGFFGTENSGNGFKNQNEKYSNSFLILRIPLTKWS